MGKETREQPSILSRLVRLKRDWQALFPAAHDQSEVLRDTRWTRDTFLRLALIGIGAIGIYALQWKPVGFARIFANGVLLALASMSAGICIGFLFGIPRAPTVEDEDGKRRYGVNTNLEQISDWLTKIIVGVSLIQLRAVPGYVSRLLQRLGPSFGGDLGFVLSILVGYSVCGFLVGYLLTRLYMAGALSRADQTLRQIGREVARVGRATAEKDTAGTTDPAVDPVSPDQESAAIEVGRLALVADTQALRDQVAALAREYEAIRAAYPSGTERTRMMSVVASKMRALSLACYSLLPALARSRKPGERLAAVSFLEVKPSEELVPWLAERIEQEKPFVGYHSAWALRHAARKLPLSALPPVAEAIRRGLAYLREHDPAAGDRIATLEAALRELEQRQAEA